MRVCPSIKILTYEVYASPSYDQNLHVPYSQNHLDPRDTFCAALGIEGQEGAACQIDGAVGRLSEGVGESVLAALVRHNARAVTYLRDVNRLKWNLQPDVPGITDSEPHVW